MAHSEACELFIEQQIKESLEEGKTPYSIGKELAVWLEKLFEAKIPVETLKKRAQRIQKKIGTNVPNQTTIQDDSENQEKQTNQTVTEQSPSNEHVPGPGRKPKYKAQVEIQYATDAMEFAVMAISQLERIRKEDPLGIEALERVALWIKQQKQEK